jgi:autotransporter-associated beta strand protein
LIRDQVPLTPDQRRAVLQKLQRPDVPNLVAALNADFKAEPSIGFGDLPIHRQLLISQLDELKAEHGRSTSFIYTYLRKLAPSADVNLEFDEAEREAWLDRVWAFAEGITSHKTLKARILYLRLDHDRKKGVYDRGRLLAYLKLPRRMPYINANFLRTYNSDWCDLDADLSDPLLNSPPIRNDEELVRDYFLHLFAKSADQNSTAPALLAPWTEHVSDTWLKPILAEALITNGIGNPERWASLITPTAFQQLKDRVDIEFPATNAPQFLPGDDIAFDVIVKNTPKLIVKIFELNTLNFFQTQQRQLNTDLNLDGLVANSEQTHAFDGGPFARTRQKFAFPDLKGKRGAWIIEFIGGGRSSRALIRTGQWHVLQQTGPAGDLILVLDEKNQPVKDAVAWFEGRKFSVDEKLGRIAIPFTNQPGTKNFIIGDSAGTFATLTQFNHHGEEYRLDAQFHIEREQLLARREATLAVRTALMLGETHLAPELLTEPKLTITSTTHDGISTTREVKDLKLSAGSVLTHTLTVPERLAALSVTFSAKVDVLSAGGTKKDLAASHTWTLNGIDKTEAVNDGHLSTFNGQRTFELLGKNGEPVADQQIVFTFKHRDFTRVQTHALKTDDKGRIALGKLEGIEQLTAKSPNGRSSSWTLEEADSTLSTTIHAKEGEAILIPILNEDDLSEMAKQPPVPANEVTMYLNYSLLELRSGTYTAGKTENVVLHLHDGFAPAGAAHDRPLGFFEIKELPSGDYSFRLFGQEPISIKVTKGDVIGGWALGKHRQLELKGNSPLHITETTTDKDFITVKLAHSSAFARVHVAASRFDPGSGIFGGLGGFARFGAASGTPARNPNLYSAGREIGDEYRYILERRYAKLFPGNMLTRPGLLLNPWEIRSTDLADLHQQAGEGAGVTHGGAAPSINRPVPQSAMKRQAQAGPQGGTNLDFLASAAPVIYNLVPDKDGVVRIERKALGDRQHVQIYAEDLQNASWRTLTLPEVPTKFADQRLARNLDPAKPFTQKKEITVLDTGKSLTLADILTSELETYDTLGGIHSLFTTLNGDPNLAKFAFILNWPKLKNDEKQAKYSEHACHELSFFLSRKDKPFFDKIIKPYLANKKDKTFMDEYLLGLDLSKHLEPWAYARLNIVERILLAQRIENEAPHAARNVRELWEMIPPNPEEADRLFETALRGRAMEDGKDRAGLALQEAAKSERLGALMAPAAPPPAPMPVAAAAADSFAAGAPGGGGFAKGMGMGGAGASSSLRRSVTVEELKRLSDAKDKEGDRMAGRKELEALGAERQLALSKSGASTFALNGVNTYTGATTISGGTLYFGTEVAGRARQQVRALYRALGPTKEWAENNYYKLRITEQNADLVAVNAFWRDYAAWVAAGSKGGFVSANVAEAHRTFTEMMLALAVLDLPFEAPKHTTKAENGQFTFTAGGPCILFHKEIKPVDGDKTAQGQLLVSQSFFRHGDRYRTEGNEKFEKYVSAEFLTGVTYGANVVVTNPTSSRVKAAVLLQIPQGALPVLGSKATDSKQVRLEPYTTQTFEYHFYFPAVSAKAGVKFAHFPVNVGGAAAKPMEFNVVAKLTQVDKASWDYVSQNSTEAEVFAFLEQNNLEALDFERIAWRCKQGDFYKKLVAFMRLHHVIDETVATYAFLHNDAAMLGQILKEEESYGPYFASKLLTIDPIELRSYEHLEYSPLVNQRAHRLGGEWRVANPAVLQQYTQLLAALAHKPQLDAMDSMSVTYFLFLQDRVEEALARFKAIDATKLPTRLQHDYFQCYAAFYEGDVAAARGIASKRLSTSDRSDKSDQSDLPSRWETLFSEVLRQAEEIEGKTFKGEKIDQPDREAQQSTLAATEPGFDFKVEKQTISLNWKNLSEVTLNYYLMDPEFSFSSNPFVSQDAGRFSIIKPNKTATQVLPKDATKLDVPLPGEFAKANVLVEVIGAGKRQTQAYHANTLKLTLTENYGRLETRDATTDKPLPKAYVKVYAKLNNGTVRFFKDGYTDLRGRFDYASLNASENGAPQPVANDGAPANGLDYQMLKPAELNNVEKLSLLVLSDTHGATVKEVDPPGR